MLGLLSRRRAPRVPADGWTPSTFEISDCGQTVDEPGWHSPDGSLPVFISEAYDPIVVWEQVHTELSLAPVGLLAPVRSIVCTGHQVGEIFGQTGAIAMAQPQTGTLIFGRSRSRERKPTLLCDLETLAHEAAHLLDPQMTGGPPAAYAAAWEQACRDDPRELPGAMAHYPEHLVGSEMWANVISWLLCDRHSRFHSLAYAAHHQGFYDTTAMTLYPQRAAVAAAFLDGLDVPAARRAAVATAAPAE
jgi:hypothetical protein